MERLKTYNEIELRGLITSHSNKIGGTVPDSLPLARAPVGE